MIRPCYPACKVQGENLEVLEAALLLEVMYVCTEAKALGKLGRVICIG